MNYDTLLVEVDAIIASDKEVNDKLKDICILLDREIEYYNWTGFYFRNGDREELILGPYVGAETDHTIIPFGRGICGQVAVSNETFLVPDVTKESNYLSCSIDTKAEIVIPIIKNGHNIGQLDIDSHYINPFSPQDIHFLTHVCNKLISIL